jgi:AmiR/NasT family two-component response regulator
MDFSNGSALRIVIAAHDPEFRFFLKDVLENQFGHDVVCEASTGTDMVNTVLDYEPDVVVFDLHLPRASGLDALRRIYQERAVAAVAVTPAGDQDLVRQVLGDYALAYVVKPVEPHQLEPAIMVAWAEYQRGHRLMAENATLRRTLEDRKIIERAKGVLMRKHHWSEDEAYCHLRRGAMNRRAPMVQLAQAVLNGTDMDVRYRATNGNGHKTTTGDGYKASHGNGHVRPMHTRMRRYSTA